METIHYWAITMEIFTIIIILFVLGLFIFKLYCRLTPERKQISGPIKFINILCVLLFLGVISLDLTHEVSGLYYDQYLYESGHHFNTLRLTSDGLYFASSIIMYTIFVFKIYVVFNDTPYALHSLFYIIYIASVLAFIICAIIIKYSQRQIESRSNSLTYENENEFECK